MGDFEDFQPEAMQALLQRAYGRPMRWHVEAMPAGATQRPCFRVFLPEQSESAVAFFVPDGGRSEEIDPVDPSGWPSCPFVEVQRLLHERGVRVPSLLADASKDVTGHDAGWVLVEDLGDTTLAVYLQRHPEERERLYQRAVRDLVWAQRALAAMPADSLVAQRVFDEDVLRRELEHFRVWALEGQDYVLSPTDRVAFDDLTARLARRIAAWPRRFVHRDYQSRNLMVCTDPNDPAAPATLAWIDFQDALLGPYLYDLVALLNDSSQTFERSFVEARLSEFAATADLEMSVRQTIVGHFDLLTVQRKLKDAGRFVYVDRVQGNAAFRPFVNGTLARALAALARLDQDDDARKLTILLRRVLSLSPP